MPQGYQREPHAAVKPFVLHGWDGLAKMSMGRGGRRGIFYG